MTTIQKTNIRKETFKQMMDYFFDSQDEGNNTIVSMHAIKTEDGDFALSFERKPFTEHLEELRTKDKLEVNNVYKAMIA